MRNLLAVDPPGTLRYIAGIVVMLVGVVEYQNWEAETSWACKQPACLIVHSMFFCTRIHLMS